LALCAFAGAHALAEPSASPRLIADWQGPPECNISTAVEEEVARLLVGTEQASSPLTMKIRVARAGMGYTAVLETADGLRRELESGSCEDLTKPIAVIIALSIDPEATSRALDETSGGTSDGANQPLEPPSSNEPPIPTSDPQPPRPRELPVETLQRDPGTTQRTKARALTFFARAAATSDFETLPAPSTGPALYAGLSMGVFRVEAGVLYLLPRTATVGAQTSKGAELDLLSAALLGCLVPVRVTVELGGCLGVEAGEIRGESFGIRTPGAGAADWIAVRGGGFIGFRLDRRLSLVGRGELLARIGRSEFLIEGVGSVHRPGSVGGRVDLGVELRVP
jgi:hypothetical protein